jgi:hypothetical protein
LLGDSISPKFFENLLTLDTRVQFFSTTHGNVISYVGGNDALLPATPGPVVRPQAQGFVVELDMALEALLQSNPVFDTSRITVPRCNTWSNRLVLGRPEVGSLQGIEL